MLTPFLTDRSYGREADLHDDVAERPQWVDCGRSLLFERGHSGIGYPAKTLPAHPRVTFSAKGTRSPSSEIFSLCEKSTGLFHLMGANFFSLWGERSLTH